MKTARLLLLPLVAIALVAIVLAIYAAFAAGRLQREERHELHRDVAPGLVVDPERGEVVGQDARHQPDLQPAVDHLVGGRCDVLIADLGSLRGDVIGLIDRLLAQFPELIVMATGRREEEGAVGSLISSGRIYRFLHKPVSPARAGQFLNAATRRYNELHDELPVGMQTVRTIARRRPYLSKTLVGAAGGGVLAAVITFAIWQSQDARLPATMPTTQVGDVPVEDVIKTQLGSAQIAYLSGRLIEIATKAAEFYAKLEGKEAGVS